jgi:hypothetical protein
MQPAFSSLYTQVPGRALVYSFAIYHSLALPTYYELSLEQNQGGRVRWVVPMPLRQLDKRPVLLWQPPALPQLSSLSCIETGALQLATAPSGTGRTLRTELALGVLRLHFRGRLLRGYYRLQCLPTGCGQFWQLSAVGRV